MRMGMFGIEVKSIFEYTYSNPGGGAQMEWKSIAGTIKVRMSQARPHPFHTQQRRRRRLTAACLVQELYGCYTFIPEGDGTKVIYKLRVEPGAWNREAAGKASSFLRAHPCAPRACSPL